MNGLITTGHNRFIAFTADVMMVIAAWLGAYCLRLELAQLPVILKKGLWLIPWVVMIQAACFWYVGLYRGVWRFASIADLLRILKAALMGVTSIGLLLFMVRQDVLVPVAIPIIYALLLILLLSGQRLIFRLLKNYRHWFNDGQRVLIIGAGNAGESIARDLLRHNYKPVGFVDDDLAKQNLEIHGIPVLGKTTYIPNIAIRYNIELILIAMPSLSSANMRIIVSHCEQSGIPFQTLPGLKDLAACRVSVNALRQVSLEDLLGRDEVQLDWPLISQGLQNRTILVTGGGGSIGSELCRQIAPLAPAALIIVEQHEFNLYRIDMDLRQRFPHLKLHTELLSITDKVGIDDVMRHYQPDMVFHAAAYKHVPLLEHQVRMAVYNNVIGTQIVAEAALAHGVSTFVLISTDKAVNPTNIMGASKRAAELFCQNLQAQSEKTRFITVRFGNVLGSAGSVVPLFQRQLAAGGPLTVTHPEITRFFMTIPEASQLIMQASVLGQGGEIFVLDMGEPIKIQYLAEQMIKLAGRTLGDDIDIIYSGLRPGEKLYEELFYANEALQATRHPKILQAAFEVVNGSKLIELLEKLSQACEQANTHQLLALLNELVPEYRVAK